MNYLKTLPFDVFDDEIFSKVSSSTSDDEKQAMRESAAKYEETAATFMVNAIAAKAREAGTTLTSEDEEYIRKSFKSALLFAAMLS